MKKEYILWNKDSVEDNRIVEDIREYTNGAICLNEDQLNLGIYKAPVPQHHNKNQHGKNQRKKNKKKY
jgi:hypothetical protein